MSSKRILASAVVLIALSALAVMAFSGGTDPDSVEASPLPPPVTTSSEPDFAAIVESDAVTGPLSEEEEILTEMAHAGASTTTVVETTTTTSPPTTTTTQKPAQQPKPTSPPSTTATTSPPATSPPSTVAAGFLSGAESEFGSLINSRRSANGLGSLSRDGSLDAHARAWAKQMASNGSISHSGIGSLLPPWNSAGENVGSGGSVSGIFNALASSPGHDTNILGEYTHVGIGVWRDGQGVLWTSHVFAR